MDRLIEGALKRLYPLRYLATVFPWPAGQAPGANAGGSGQKRKLAASDAESGDAASAGDETAARRRKQQRGPAHEGSPSGSAEIAREAPPGPSSGIARPEDENEHGQSLPPPPSNAADEEYLRADDGMEAPPALAPFVSEAEDEGMHPGTLPHQETVEVPRDGGEIMVTRDNADSGVASSAGDETGARRCGQQRGPAHEGSPSDSAEIAREALPGPSSGIARPEDESEHGHSLPRPSGAADEEYLRADAGMEAPPALAPVVAEAEDEGMHPGTLPPRDGGEMEVLRPPPPHVPRQEADGSHHQDIVHGPAGSGDVISRSGDEMEPVVGLTHIAQPGRDMSRRGRTRAVNWTPHETLKLIESKLRNLNWEAIAVLITGRTGTQCRQRWDTLVKLYKQIKRHCDGRGKDFAEVTEAELRSMKKVRVHHWKSGIWYNMIDEFQRQRPPSGRPYALRPNPVTAAARAEEPTAAGGAAGARNMEVGVVTDSYLLDALEEHQAGEYATQMHAA